MDIINFAMELEVENENYYRNMLKKIKDKNIRAVLKLIAADEEKHYQVLSKMKRTLDLPMGETSILKSAKDIFEEAKKNSVIFDIPADMGELLAQAQDLEKKIEDFYIQKSGEMKKDAQKELFLKLAEEEKKHFFLLENLITFLSRPSTWIENAEFNHLDEY